MRYLWDDSDKITALLKSNQAKLLMLDFDGTLTPIVKPPKKALLSSRAKDILQKLSTKQGVLLAIISGRELEVLKERVQIPDIIYGGIHGLEGEIYTKRHLFPLSKQYFLVLTEIQNKIQAIMPGFNGALFLNKKLTLALDYRSVKQPQIKPLKALFDKILGAYLENGVVSILSGKKVWEIIPNVNWDKGSFAKLLVEQITRTNKSIPIAIYIGDDKTDENVFKKLGSGLTIRVGKHNHSKAKYYLRNTTDVLKFLQFLYNEII